MIHPAVVRCILCATSVSALALSSAGAQAPVVRDSAGVRIVQNPSRARAPVVFQLGAKPVVDLGGPEEPTDNEFNPSQGYLRAARLSDGGFAVIDVARVHFFDARGKRVRIVGRSGGGPNEFRYLIMICRTRGDTIVVSDSRNKRFTILDKTGAIVRELPQGELGFPPSDTCFDDGTIVLERSPFTPSGPSRQAHFTRVSLDGALVNTVGDFLRPPFDAVTGSHISAISWKDCLYFGNGMTNEVRVYTQTGTLSRIIRSADPLVRITEAEAEQVMRASIPRNVGGAEAAERMERMRGMRPATTWPAYDRLEVDPSGTLWVQDNRTRHPGPDVWTAFDRDGRLVGRLVIPEPKFGQRRMEIIRFESDGLLVRRSDDDGFAHLTLYPIERIRR